MCDSAIALFAYARPDHLAQTLEGLRANRVPLIYAFSDGARTPDKARQVASVREMLRAVDWCDLKLIERNENLGLAQSIMRGVSSVLDEHESVIVLEDDCVPLDGFYKFMVQSLDRYHPDGRVGCISGYGLPGVRRPWWYRADGYFTERMSSWGWATWRRAWRLLEHDWTVVRQRLRNHRLDLRHVGEDVRCWLNPEFEGRIGRQVWTPLWLFPLYLQGLKTLWPFESYVRNIGLDGTGVNCGAGGARFFDIEGQAPAPDEFRYPRRVRCVNAVTRQFARVFGGRPVESPLWRRPKMMMRKIPGCVWLYRRMRAASGRSAG